MEQIQVKEELRVIREMLEKTKKSTAESGTFFLVWGFLIIFAVIGTYLLVFAGKYSWIWLNWAVFMGSGIVFSFVYWGRKERRAGVKTHASSAAGYLGIACGVAFIFVGLIFPAFKLYSWEVISLLITTIFGTSIFALGGIINWNLLKWCGVISWLFALGMMFIPAEFRTLVFVPLILIGYILPGLILKFRYKKERLQK